MGNNAWNHIYSNDQTGLRKLQLAELEIIRFFDEKCTEHKWRYYLGGGTMLGAVRHGGFIPWDDDTDVSLPRPEYEEFLSVIGGELPPGFELLNYRLSPDYNRCFSRIINRKIKIQNASNTKTITEYAWLDIFPLDGMPSGALHQRLHFLRLLITRFLYHASCFEELVNLNRPGRPFYQRVAIKFLAVTHFGSQLNTKKLISKMERQLVKYPYDSADTVVSFFGAYLWREVLPKAFFGIGARYPFEGLMLQGAQEYDAFLTHFFGDYMTPPKDADKDKHNILVIETNEEY